VIPVALAAIRPLDAASIVLVGIAFLGVLGAAVFAVLRRRAQSGLAPGTAVRRAGSYAALALALLLAARTGVPGVAVLVGVLAAIGLLEWSAMFGLPSHHRVSLLIADVILVVAIGREGVAAADWLVGGLVLLGAAWPVLRVDTGRAVRDLGAAAVGFILIPVLLVHGLALAVERGEAGIVLFVALAVSCAGSDVAAFVVGRRFGRTPLAVRLSPTKTRAGVVGNVLGAAVGLGPFVPALVPAFPPAFVVALVPLVAAGAVWGDLLESAVKREVGVKDAASWLPGFGGILDRIDSLLITVALAYWVLRIVEPG
jgi:phosphatidate cytidylyltransferase